MRSKVGILLAVTVGLILPAVAAAKTNTLKGKFQSSDGSVNAPVSLKVTLSSGKKPKPTKVTSIGVTSLNYRCPDDDTSGKLDFKLPGPFGLKYSASTKTYTASKTVKADGRSYRVFLNVPKSGKSASGTIDFSFNNAAGNECLNGVDSFKVKK